MSRELLRRHLFRSSGGWSGGGSRRLRNRGFSFLFGTIPTEVSRLSASEAQTLLHQLSSLLIRHRLEYFRDDIKVHGVFISLFSEVPPGFSLFLLWCVSFDDPLHLVVVVINFQGFLVPSSEIRFSLGGYGSFEEGGSMNWHLLLRGRLM